MMTIRTLASVLSVAMLLAGCDPQNELDKKAPTISTASMRADGKAAVVAELFFDNRKCSRGNIVLGTEDGTRTTDRIETRDADAGPGFEYAGALLRAGTYHIVRLDCSYAGYEYQFASYRRRPGVFLSGIYAPLGSFTVAAGEVAYVGSLHAVSGKKKAFRPLTPAAIAIEDRAEQVRQTLRQSSPALADAMVVRLAAPVYEIPLPDLLPAN